MRPKAQRWPQIAGPLTGIAPPDCTHVAAMDKRRGKWFIYVRYQPTWQLATPSLSTVTIYYDRIPLEIQRGWLVNYFGTKVIVREGDTKVHLLRLNCFSFQREANICCQGFKHLLVVGLG